MSENDFILDSMTWSFSRLSSYYQCPYEWKLRYIDCIPKEDSFFGQYGSFIHKILELYAKGEIDFFDICNYYGEHYNEEIYISAPYNAYTDIAENYYKKGYDYVCNLSPFCENFEILGVEKEVKFQIENFDFVGYIDLLLRDKVSGEITILDHKSASLKFKKNGEIAKISREHFKNFKRQLYLYSKPVIEEYGHVDSLSWNLFNIQKTVAINWDKDEYTEAIDWALNTIYKIKEAQDFQCNPDFYYCRNLCSVRNAGICEANQVSGEERSEEY